MTVCATSGGTSINPASKSGAGKSWGLVLGKDGLPQGVRAFDATGKAVGASRKMPFTNVYVMPEAAKR